MDGPAHEPSINAGPADTPDAVLVARAGEGDLEAFERLIEKFQQSVFHIALYKSRNYFDAEDLTQDIFLAAYKALPTLKTPENFSSWLFGIAYNRCHKWFRRERTKIIKFAELKRRAAGEESRRMREDARERSVGASDHVSDQVKRLPADIGRVLTMKYLDGLSYQEIEAELGINANRIDYLIRKGKQLLRARLSGEGHA